MELKAPMLISKHEMSKRHVRRPIFINFPSLHSKIEVSSKLPRMVSLEDFAIYLDQQ